MPRLLIHVEGETEEAFVNEVLAPRLREYGFGTIGARLIGNARLRHRRGGIRAWSTVRLDIVKHLREDAGAVATTMVDFYALPSSGDKAWPGRDAAAKLPFNKKAPSVEDALHADLSNAMGGRFDPRRFIPFVIMHEFEGLLFSDCAAFSRGIHRADLQSHFQDIRDQFKTPEEINDSPETAPSKRVIKLIPHYEKPLLGTLAALEMGLESIEAQCPYFKAWLTRLEKAAKTL